MLSPVTTRKVSKAGKIRFASKPCHVGVWLDGETVEVSVADGLVSAAAVNTERSLNAGGRPSRTNAADNIFVAVFAVILADAFPSSE